MTSAEILQSINGHIQRAHCHIAGHVDGHWERWTRTDHPYVWRRIRLCERCGEVLQRQIAVANEQGVHVDTKTGKVTRLEIN